MDSDCLLTINEYFPEIHHIFHIIHHIFHIITARPAGWRAEWYVCVLKSLQSMRSTSERLSGSTNRYMRGGAACVRAWVCGCAGQVRETAACVCLKESVLSLLSTSNKNNHISTGADRLPLSDQRRLSRSTTINRKNPKKFRHFFKISTLNHWTALL